VNFQGKVRDDSDSFAIVDTCDGVQGEVFDGNSLYTIKTTHGINSKYLTIK
jgi:hypothetical protein